MLLNPLTFHAPISLSEAIKLYTSLDNARLQAGGTFLLNSLKLLKRKSSKTPEHIVSLNKINELKGVFEANGELTIKAMTTINELSSSPHLCDHLSVLKTVCKNISTNPIRNMATVGGNLTCRYTWTEMPVTMIGLEAQMHFIGQDGATETTNAEEFYKNAAKTDKIFTHVTVRRDPSASVTYRRVKKSPNVDIPLLSILIKTNFHGRKFNNTRVSVNNCVTFAQRDYKLEQFLNQSACSPDLAEDALNHLDESIYDTRSNDYKSHMFRVSLKSALQELVETNR
jgi:CO/xanthine dehydrogenase FAD-binding subunit